MLWLRKCTLRFHCYGGTYVFNNTYTETVVQDLAGLYFARLPRLDPVTSLKATIGAQGNRLSSLIP